MQGSLPHVGSRHVLGMRVDAVEFDQARDRVLDMVTSCDDPRPGRYICATNVHMAMESWDDPGFRALVNDADLCLADGQPMVWALRALGLRQQRRVRVSPDLLQELFVGCEAEGVPVALYGGTPETLRQMTHALSTTYPHLRLVCAIAPPFRPPTPEEDQRDVRLIRESGARLLLVGIGCPKQERWMAAHRGSLPCVMFGVGAAFDLLGGRTRNAPAWTRGIGLEWAYRLLLEPRRLWRRYLHHNPRFVVLLLRQVLVERMRRVTTG